MYHSDILSPIVVPANWEATAYGNGDYHHAAWCVAFLSLDTRLINPGGLELIKKL